VWGILIIPFSATGLLNLLFSKCAQIHFEYIKSFSLGGGGVYHMGGRYLVFWGAGYILSVVNIGEYYFVFETVAVFDLNKFREKEEKNYLKSKTNSFLYFIV
jgi:hypothetical protein